MVLHIYTNIGPMLKYWIAPVGSAPVLCLCVNLLPTKYYIVSVGSVTYVSSLTGLGSIAKTQHLSMLNMYRAVCVLS
jgi:hypothetical protein